MNNIIRPGGTRERPADSDVPSGHDFIRRLPDTVCLANFRLSLPGRSNPSRVQGYGPLNPPNIQQTGIFLSFLSDLAPGGALLVNK
jgi:hypothetical protein